MTLRHDQQPRTICGFGMTPVTSSSLVPTSTSNEFHTRSDELRARSRYAVQRVSHSCRRASRSFQIRSPTSLTLVPTSFALVPDSQLTVAINRGRTGNHRPRRAPQQRAEEKNSTALRYHVCRASVSHVQHTFLDNCGKGCGSHVIKYAQSVKLKAMCNVQVWRVDGLAKFAKKKSKKNLKKNVEKKTPDLTEKRIYKISKI